jgi:hypothetical protein
MLRLPLHQIPRRRWSGEAAGATPNGFALITPQARHDRHAVTSSATEVASTTTRSLTVVQPIGRLPGVLVRRCDVSSCHQRSRGKARNAAVSALLSKSEHMTVVLVHADRSQTVTARRIGESGTHDAWWFHGLGRRLGDGERVVGHASVRPGRFARPIPPTVRGETIDARICADGRLRSQHRQRPHLVKFVDRSHKNAHRASIGRPVSARRKPMPVQDDPPAQDCQVHSVGPPSWRRGSQSTNDLGAPAPTRRALAERFRRCYRTRCLCRWSRAVIGPLPDPRWHRAPGSGAGPAHGVQA